jgi:hypothetical protein
MLSKSPADSELQRRAVPCRAVFTFGVANEDRQDKQTTDNKHSPGCRKIDDDELVAGRSIEGAQFFHIF